ncbi:MCE family protein [Phaeovibrio sulfidiphilus]|uniref:MCE family protein n=1 Tax=Phaeovibrio sulfidiphilus TaxID=1220600 RepID=A0A8J6YPK8_9PROT|nr:MlaD family protein [Phaeovibrio sulfidiphilus]MBE1237301.1 MCE family protein [Phaeovibrio sulfidiphilus]
MEVRANYIVVGAFFLAALAGILFTLLWLMSDTTGTVMDEYDISFKESVTGLSVGNAVLFSGIRVGTVSRIKISEEEPGAVVVRVSVSADTPVRADSVASLTLQGITGVSVVSITGGTRGSPLIDLKPGEVGTIRSKTSPLAALMKDAPGVAARIDRVLLNLEELTNRENREAVSRILANAATVSDAVASRSEALQNTLGNVETAVDRFNSVMDQASSTLGRYNDVGKNLELLSATLNQEIGALSREAFPQVRQLVSELRGLTHTLNRIGQQLESDPRHFLLGDPVKEYTP